MGPKVRCAGAAALLLALIATSSCGGSATGSSESLFAALSLAEVRRSAASGPAQVGWERPRPEPGRTSGDDPSSDDPSIGSLRIGDRARSVVWLEPGDRVSLPIARGPEKRRLRLDAGATGDAAGLEVSIETPDGKTRSLGSLAAIGSDRWTQAELELPAAVAGGFDRLIFEASGTARLGLATLRVEPPIPGPGGLDLLLVCDPGPVNTDPDALSAPRCWAQSPDPELALASLLSGQHPSTHRALESGRAVARLLGGTNAPQSLGTLLRDAGFETELIAERGAPGALAPIDLGFESQVVVDAGRGLAAATSRLDPDDGRRRALLVTRSQSGPVDPAAAAVFVHIGLPRATTDETTIAVEQVAVGMAVGAADLAAGELAEGAMHVDLLPTLCDLLGLEAPVGVQGRSLVQRGPDGRWYCDPGEQPRLLWSELPGRVHLAEFGARRTWWAPGGDPGGSGAEWSVEVDGTDERPLEPSAERAQAIRARVAALAAYREALYERGSD